MDVSAPTQIESLLSAIVSRNVQPDALAWLYEKGGAVRNENNAARLNTAFAAVPRKTGRNGIELTDMEQEQLESMYKGFSINHWTADRLCRLWLLLQVNDTDQQIYCATIENLFKGAEVNELIALYASLIILKYPEAWRLRCAEGIRSNIGSVLEAIMYENPYPQFYLDEPAWNQLVLKAFFTEKDVNRITGLDEKANKKLASVLVDYAHERWAAQRAVNPLLWRLVAGFIDERNFSDITRLFTNGDLREKKAAVLACHQSNYEPARRMADHDPELKLAVNNKVLSWETL